MASFYRILPWLIGTWMLFAVYWYTCELHYHNCSCFRKRPAIPAMQVYLNGDTLLRFDAPLTFELDKSNMILTTKQHANIDALTHYLLQHPDQLLQITALQTASEPANLAQARSQTVRQIFIDHFRQFSKIERHHRPVFDSLLQLQTNIQAQPIVFQDTLFNALQLSVKPRHPLDPKVIQQLLTDTVRLSFEKKNNKFWISDPQIQYFHQLKRLIDQYPSKKIYLIGHADNDDTYENNIILGRKRAEIVKQLMVDIGISPSKIIADSRGENQPIDNNNTIAGQQKNRRVDIFIK